MLLHLFTKNIQREFSKIPRILPLNSALTRFKIWEEEESQKKYDADKKIYAVSIETGQIYASLDQNKITMMQKDPYNNSILSQMVTPYPYAGIELKNYIANEHILNGEPNHIITLNGLKPDVIHHQLKWFLRVGHCYRSMISIGMSGVVLKNEENMKQLLINVLERSGIESILKKPLVEKSESGIINVLVQAEHIEKNQENSNQNSCKKQ